MSKETKNKYLITLKGIFPSTRNQTSDLETGMRSFEFIGTPEELSAEIKRLSKDESQQKVISVIDPTEVLVEFNRKEEWVIEVKNCYTWETFYTRFADIYPMGNNDPELEKLKVGLIQNSFSRSLLKVSDYEKLKLNRIV